MLKELIVGDTTFFFECSVNGDVIEYMLYDSVENWVASKTKEEVAQTLQHLNKRIKFDVATAYDTLQNTEPESANWAESDVETNQVDVHAACERILELKYRVKGCRLNFEWCLKRQDNTLTIPLPVHQVASVVNKLPAQVEELLDVLRRKEDEIKQYRTEYGSLRRSTVATNAFHVDKFRERYAATDNKVKILQKIIARWQAEHGETESAQEAETSIRNNGSPTNRVKIEDADKSSPSGHKNVRESPRNRKRKAMQMQKARMTRTLQSRRQKLEYESQSQTLSESEQPQGTDEVIPKVSENVINSDNCTDDARNNEKNAENYGQTNIRLPTEKLTSNAAKTVPSPINNSASETAKEVASKKQNLSPRVVERPNTRQRRRECAMHENNSIELKVIENPAQSEVYTVDECTEPVKISGVTSVVPDKASKSKCLANSQKLSASQLVHTKEYPKNDISAYVDSVLSKLDALIRD
ncbi:uncharacterized protein LOC128857164 [Anastrepha ludens]|uniref:uncharacterized protein LOC128857164 n=1 Tax=Anastrepha ludens TaxID=28586 RepID=UPI0023B1152A|nr:uncharacterized protein LOC128857164 [Anastrepha ludens]